MMSQINGELRVSGSKLILIEAGSRSSASIHMQNVFNSGADEIDIFTVWDENIGGVNFDFDRAVPLNPTESARKLGYTSGIVQAISFDSGVTNYNNGFGMTAYPNVRENVVGTGASIPTANDTTMSPPQLCRKLTTGSVGNTVRACNSFNHTIRGPPTWGSLRDSGMSRCQRLALLAFVCLLDSSGQIMSLHRQHLQRRPLLVIP